MRPCWASASAARCWPCSCVSAAASTPRRPTSAPTWSARSRADIPEDDPRNAATIADNVGDNVGDCAGMAADIFESYEVTIVAAMILGMASFGHKGVIFPLLVRAIGVLGSIISTYSVKAGANDTSDTALKSVNRGFLIGSAISHRRLHRPGPGLPALRRRPTSPSTRTADGRLPRRRPAATCRSGRTSASAGARHAPGLTCLIGIILAVALNKVTSYYTGTTPRPGEEPGQGLPDRPRHQHHPGLRRRLRDRPSWPRSSSPAAIFAVGALSTPAPTPIFIAYGVAMCGIGMLTLTGNTISMDVFGPVADNANGIGEMGYDEKEMGEAELQARPARSWPTSTRWATPPRPITKGIAIGSAVIAAVSLFARFIAGRLAAAAAKRSIMPMTRLQYTVAGAADRLRSQAVHRHADRRRRAVPVQLDD